MFRSRWGTESGGRNLESRICDLLNLAVRGRFALARRFEGWRGAMNGYRTVRKGGNKIQKFVWHTDCLRFNVGGHGFSWQPNTPQATCQKSLCILTPLFHDNGNAQAPFT